MNLTTLGFSGFLYFDLLGLFTTFVSYWVGLVLCCLWLLYWGLRAVALLIISLLLLLELV